MLILTFYVAGYYLFSLAKWLSYPLTPWYTYKYLSIPDVRFIQKRSDRFASDSRTKLNNGTLDSLYCIHQVLCYNFKLFVSSFIHKCGWEFDKRWYQELVAENSYDRDRFDRTGCELVASTCSITWVLSWRIICSYI